MRYVTQKLAFAALVAVLVSLGTGAGAAPPSVPPAPDLSDAPSVELGSRAPAALGAEAEDPLCLADPGGEAELVLEPSPDAEQKVGSPCCQTLCDQICGVNQACACRRCVVFGCEL